MDLLILGGTVFLGRHLAGAALAAGHRVSLFHRGRSGPDLFPEAEHLIGDRDGDLTALTGRRFDAVVDCSTYTPGQLEAVVEALDPETPHYTLVSSVSVYAEPQAGDDERAALATLPDGHDGSLSPESYGPLKALAEQTLQRLLPGRCAVVRPGLIVGPYDTSERFTWWPRRLAAGGTALAPAPRERHVQLIDARDLAAWLLRVAEGGVGGVFNAVGPEQPLSRQAFVAGCRSAADDPAEVVWIDEGWLTEQGVRPWMELPLWLPAGSDGMLAVSGAAAFAAGLRCRPLEETAADTLAWDRARGAPPPVRSSLTGAAVQVGLDPEREAELLAAWAAR